MRYGRGSYAYGIKDFFTLFWMLTLDGRGKAEDFQTSAQQLLLVDDDTDTVLFEKQSDIPFSCVISKTDDSRSYISSIKRRIVK